MRACDMNIIAHGGNGVSPDNNTFAITLRNKRID